MTNFVTAGKDALDIPEAELRRFVALVNDMGAHDVQSAKRLDTVRQLARLADTYRLDNLAVSLYLRILELDPGSSDARTSLSSVYARHGLAVSAQVLMGVATQAREVSVYIPCFNVAPYLDDCLKSVFAQSYPVSEVLVIDDGSTDATKEIASRYPVRLVTHSSNRGLSCSRNTALSLARSEFLAGIDADVVLDRFWLERCMARIEDPRYAGVGGRLEEMNRFSLADKWRARLMAQHHGDTARENVDIYGCNSLFRTEVLRSVGGFDERYRTSFDDIDLSERLRAAGHPTVYEPLAFCIHQRRDSLASLCRSAYRWRVPPYERAGAFESVDNISAKWVRELRFAISEISSLHDEGIGELVFPTFYMGFSSLMQDVLEFATSKGREPLELPFAYLFLLKGIRDAGALPAVAKEVCVQLLTAEFERFCPESVCAEVLTTSHRPLSVHEIREVQSRSGGDVDLLRRIESTLEGVGAILAFSPEIQRELARGAEVAREELTSQSVPNQSRVVVLGDGDAAQEERERLRVAGARVWVVSARSGIETPVGTLAALAVLAPESVVLASISSSDRERRAFGAQLKAALPFAHLRITDELRESGLSGWEDLL